MIICVNVVKAGCVSVFTWPRRLRFRQVQVTNNSWQAVFGSVLESLLKWCIEMVHFIRLTAALVAFIFSCETI